MGFYRIVNIYVLIFLLYRKRTLKELKEGHQEHLLNTKYLHLPIMLVSKEDLQNITEDNKEYF